MKINQVKEPGFFWAKSGDYKWHNLIIEVFGEYPFFRIRAWNRSCDKLGIIDADDIAKDCELIPISEPE